MKGLIFLLFISTVSANDESIFNELLENHIYTSDVLDTYVMYTEYEKPFKGDCDDFAFTAMFAMGGGQVWAVKHNEQYAHAVLVKDGYVYDCYYRRKMTVEESGLVFIKVITFKGYVVDNSVLGQWKIQSKWGL